MSLPLVSIIVPCYNQAPYIAECLDSVINQTYTDWECIVVDDGSNDNSAAIVREYSEKNPKIQYHFKQNGGLSSARNYGINKSNGEFILPLDGDDKISSLYLEKAVEEFFKNPKTKIIYCEAALFGAIEKKWKLSKYSYETLLLQNCIFCSAFYRKSDFLSSTGYDENMKVGYEDWDFWIQILKKNDVVTKLKDVHFFYRQREQSMISFIHKEDKHNEVLNYLTEKHKNKFLEIFNLKTDIDVYRSLQKYTTEKTKFKGSLTYKTIFKIEEFIVVGFKYLINFIKNKM